jgi:hypothetical protein
VKREAYLVKSCGWAGFLPMRVFCKIKRQKEKSKIVEVIAAPRRFRLFDL